MTSDMSGAPVKIQLSGVYIVWDCEPNSVLCPAVPGDGIEKEGEMKEYGTVTATQVVKCIAVKIKDFQETAQE